MHRVVSLLLLWHHFLVVFCFSDGAGRSGTYIAISNLVDRMKVLQVVDVFQCIKLIRSKRPQFVETVVRFDTNTLVFIYVFSKLFVMHVTDNHQVQYEKIHWYHLLPCTGTGETEF